MHIRLVRFVFQKTTRGQQQPHAHAHKHTRTSCVHTRVRCYYFNSVVYDALRADDNVIRRVRTRRLVGPVEKCRTGVPRTAGTEYAGRHADAAQSQRPLRTFDATPMCAYTHVFTYTPAARPIAIETNRSSSPFVILSSARAVLHCRGSPCRGRPRSSAAGVSTRLSRISRNILADLLGELRRQQQ